MNQVTVLKEMDAAQLKQGLEAGQVVLVDVREADEYAREHIKGASHMPLSNFDAKALNGERSQTVVFHCNSGNRTQASAQALTSSGFAEIYHLAGGIMAWKKAGLPVDVNRAAPISLMRQVQIVVGALVVLGVVLSLTVSPLFVFLSAFVGGGLAFAGLTGTCAMASILSRMPFNRPVLSDAA